MLVLNCFLAVLFMHEFHGWNILGLWALLIRPSLLVLYQITGSCMLSIILCFVGRCMHSLHA